MSKQKKLDSVGKEAFVKAVLSMLDEGVSLRELNLRTVARRVGCAHTNAYNYFTSFEDLLWWSLKGALEYMTGMVDPEHGDLVRWYVDFALDHPAWYRLIWLEQLSGTPPAGVAAYLPVPADMYTRWLMIRFGRSEKAAALELKGRILHGYLHGELAAITAGRVTGGREELTERVLTGAKELMRLLFNNSDMKGVETI
ncbi:MAG: TetR/AcrR family transcriptional regulator [Spirochaetales bacterium]|nr:TetR/AcrR family transcriptional regulator [Spirochaetales bacterium]